ncbi:hypothetical protein M3697_05410 [Janibacter melonis]|uniref:hypothetical protein n=1 Tax=Janibacter melonis TaxID=262209 RepID=UPI002044265B|nr:hypothetical protein [Janibacter melonis]MCM3554543.1 hypothetical protein [Janibacter melonis]
MEPINLGESHEFADGLKITPKNWRPGQDSISGDRYVAFDVLVQNTGSEPIDLEWYASAVYGDTGKTADEAVTDVYEDNQRRLQPGAQDTITTALELPSATVPAVVELDFLDWDDDARPELYFEVNGGVR